MFSQLLNKIFVTVSLVGAVCLKKKNTWSSIIFSKKKKDTNLVISKNIYL